MGKILFTGAAGQLGAELIAELRHRHGVDSVLATDIRAAEGILKEGPFELLDVTDEEAIRAIIKKHDISQIYHLAALLSAKAEKDIPLSRKLNIGSLHHVLNAARDLNIERVFWPSSIAVFGPDAISNGTPQNSPCNPTTVYGINKLTGEQWCAYYHRVFGVDVRSLRYPGLIGYKTLPGGGTTDYAVDIYHKALAGEPFSCFLQADTMLPMMYMEDAINATLKLMDAEPEKLSIRTSYNVAGMSFNPAQISDSIRKHIPDFSITYEPDYRQNIADSWPNSIDDSTARADWGWKPSYNLTAMTKDILEKLPGYFPVLSENL
ncbi:MAG: NAD-dependent epimerase/dehydratase family protein [Balneolales bacterium]|nr:NAD-dependent epimerase/dehydratase family protein [Balneolales bacterium]